MQVMESLFYFVVIILFMNFIIGLVNAIYPEALPPILRGKKEMNFKMKMFYSGIYGITCENSEIQAADIQRAEFAVLDELNKKRFISIADGKIVPTSSIVSVVIEPEEKGAAENVSDAI